ncbi:MAG: 3-dehydroquinate synthase [Thermodesulfobacteriota bacterium]|nr:3-dehydroquinate synthase [Thermodesulfobacteriota bacterium]
MDSITVSLGNRSYPIYFGYEILAHMGEAVRQLDISDRIVIVSNPTIGGLFMDPLEAGLKASGFSVSSIEIPDGEETKSLEWAGVLYDRLISMKTDRKSALIALGGGVIGDITGFVAATFLRGVPYIQVPTTLLAQVDSSVGGKTGVNHPKGKNLIGAFYQPKLVLIDVKTLETLERSELTSGFAEVIKYGIIWDSDLFQYLADTMDKILRLDQKSVTEVVKRCCSIKAKVVQEDERESGLRSILNFGHTIGHAIEALTEYMNYKHGEAVAIGMIAAAKISVKMGACHESIFQRIKNLVQRAGLPTELPQYSKEEYMRVIELDKKAEKGRIKFVLTEDIGRVKFAHLSAKDISNYLF